MGAAVFYCDVGLHVFISVWFKSAAQLQIMHDWRSYIKAFHSHTCVGDKEIVDTMAARNFVHRDGLQAAPRWDPAPAPGGRPTH